MTFANDRKVQVITAESAKQLRLATKVAVIAGLTLASVMTNADGLADFRNALAQFNNTQPIVLNVNFKLFGTTGEHNELVEREGLINLRVEDSGKGMMVSYTRDVVNQLHQEELAKLENDKVKNSALNAVGQFDYWEWRELLYPAMQMELALGRYQFLGEKMGDWKGNSVRVLSFSMPKEKVDLKFRKYIKNYKNILTVWIDDKGIPLASSAVEKGSGRVFVVIGFTFHNEFHMEYQQKNGRLISVRREVQESTEGATMQSRRHFISTVKSIH